MEEAWGIIKELSADERERMLAEDREKTRRDLAAYYETGLVEGLEKGHAAGLATGRAEGHAEGLATGLATGRAEERKMLIANMLGQGFSSEQICSLLDIDQSELAALARKN